MLYEPNFSSYKNQEILVTGGAGFIGSHISDKLINLGAKVAVLDDLSSGTLDNLAQIWDKITFIKDNITNFDACLKATWNKKVVFHTAAFISVPDSIKNPEACHNTNILGLINMLEAARINKVESFILSSTAAVYGASQELCTETTKCNPESTYGYSKLIGEILCKEYSNIYKINTVILRYFNVFGPRQNPDNQYSGVVSKFTKQLQDNLPITIFGDGTQTRDFIEVNKVVTANLLFGLSAKEANSEIFNIATGQSITLLELLQNLKREYPNYSNNIIFAPERPGDVKHSKADCSNYYNFINNKFLPQTQTKIHHTHQEWQTL